MSLCGSNIGGGAGTAFRFASRVFSLGGGLTCGGASMLNISLSCYRDTVYLCSNFVYGLVGIGLRRVWMRSAAAYVDEYFDDIRDNFRVSGENSVASETLYLSVLGM